MSNREIFSAKGLPVLQNKMFRSAEEAIASATGDILLVQNERTGLIYNEAFDSSKLNYDQDYQNEQACSSVFKKHLGEVSAIIEKFFQGRSLIEVGCGKGYFLEHLLNLGFEVTGIDPAYEGHNQNVVKAHFHRDLGISADGIVLRHVVEHIPEPLSFLAMLASANGGKGTIYIEVPCFDWICDHRAWFDIFYEHVNYFRIQDFSRMFGHIYDCGHVFGGQYLYVLADLATLRQPVALHGDHVEMPDDFMSGVNRAAVLVRTATGRKKNVVWGGASKGVIFLLYMQRAGVVIDGVIDINPAKQGRYLAGCGLRVSSPEDSFGYLSASDNIFVMNSNYLDEIVAQSGNRFCYFTVDHEKI